MKVLYKVFYSGHGYWNIPNSEKQIKEAKVGGVSNLHLRDWMTKQGKPDSLEAKKELWIAPLNTDFVQKFAVVAGVFNLQPLNYREIKYKNESNVQRLLPCYDHKDGVILDEYTEKDGISFTIISGFGFKKFTKEDLISEETETKTKKKLSMTADRTYLNIIAVLLEFIKGDTKDIEKHPSYVSEAQLIAAIVSDYVEIRKKANIGLSKRTLEEKFREAKNSLSQ